MYSYEIFSSVKVESGWSYQMESTCLKKRDNKAGSSPIVVFTCPGVGDMTYIFKISPYCGFSK